MVIVSRHGCRLAVVIAFLCVGFVILEARANPAVGLSVGILAWLLVADDTPPDICEMGTGETSRTRLGCAGEGMDGATIEDEDQEDDNGGGPGDENGRPPNMRIGNCTYVWYDYVGYVIDDPSRCD